MGSLPSIALRNAFIINASVPFLRVFSLGKPGYGSEAYIAANPTTRAFYLMRILPVYPLRTFSLLLFLNYIYF